MTLELGFYVFRNYVTGFHFIIYWKGFVIFGFKGAVYF